MPTGLDKIILILTIAGFIIGLSGNVFIGLVNCSEWVKNRKVSLADFIITCLAISRISNLLVSMSSSWILELSPHLSTIYEVAKSTFMLWRITNHLTTWLATCLSIFYFLKIAHFSHSVFLWLKWRMNRVVLALLVFSSFSLIFDFLLLKPFTNRSLNTYKTDESNLTLHKISYIKNLTLLSLNYFVPLALSLTSLLLLFLSLMRHTRNLQLNSVGAGDPTTEAHRRAMKMVMSFLFLFIIHFLCTEVAMWVCFIFSNNEYIKFVMLTFYLFPSGHSFILIVGNKRLRQTALRILWHLKSHLQR
ncbi:PREDICTED: taste receptor type 2 member 42-like [Galeopterus variegatus]|uniref:Taste receptor type 2 n=1 Tax=Galeopterus variegatus TaxID=482537 RepID=A0ABM0RSY3_GALVR|nr:PREDICTED: taste receptor type 2 member 42-like [Galeopterus variegatus]